MVPEIKINNNCTHCLSCSQICPTEAIIQGISKSEIDHFNCTLCELCVVVCPEGAISIDQ